MTHSLRRLMLDQKPVQETFDMRACLQEILPILSNECRSRTVEFSSFISAQAMLVTAHKVLLERILFNLVANAIDALAAHTNGTRPPRIELALQSQIRDNQPYVLVKVTDNRPGFADYLLDEEWMHFQSTKATGMGVGLILGRYILNTWQGELLLENLPSGGASVQLWLPLSEAT
jgi:C4-dicarboxylate-specific signal transduction histidine kinase